MHSPLLAWICTKVRGFILIQFHMYSRRLCLSINLFMSQVAIGQFKGYGEKELIYIVMVIKVPISSKDPTVA